MPLAYAFHIRPHSWDIGVFVGNANIGHTSSLFGGMPSASASAGVRGHPSWPCVEISPEAGYAATFRNWD